MLVCNVSLRPKGRAIAADLAEAGLAADAPGTGNIVFITLVDDPASVGEIVDAYLGEIMIEAASASDAITTGSAYATTVNEALTAADTQDASLPMGAPLDAVSGVTGAWSLGRDMLTSFAGGTRYTTAGGNVTAIKDQSGHSIDFSSATNQPLLATAFPTNVLCADFDGVNDFLTTTGTFAISNFFTASSGAMIASVIIDTVSLNNATVYNNHGILGDSGGFMGLHARNLSGVTLTSYNWDGNADSVGATGATGTAYVLMWRHHGGNLYFSINGGTEASVASGNTSNLGNQLFMGSGSIAVCDMKLAEAFATNDGSQTAALAAAIANMKTYVGA